MPQPTRIYLTGFMGSGKSTIGPILANVLGYDFIDLDDVIEDRTGMSIPQLFEQKGETGFRQMESELLEGTTRLDQIVVSLGGGALTSEQNLRMALDQGCVVYLRVPVRTLLKRLSRSSDRPLLRDSQGRLLSREALRAKVERMIEQREPYYGQAHLTIDVERLDVGRTVDHIVRNLAAFEDRSPRA